MQSDCKFENNHSLMRIFLKGVRLSKGKRPFHLKMKGLSAYPWDLYINLFSLPVNENLKQAHGSKSGISYSAGCIVRRFTCNYFFKRGSKRGLLEELIEKILKQTKYQQKLSQEFHW